MRCASSFERIAAADPGRVVGREAGEAELACARARAGLNARRRCFRRPGLVLAAAGAADDRDDDEPDCDHDQ